MSSLQNVAGRRLSDDEIYSFATLLLPAKREDDRIKSTMEKVLADPKVRQYAPHVYVDTRSDEIYGKISESRLTEKSADDNFFSMVLPNAYKMYDEWKIDREYEEMDIVRLPVVLPILDNDIEISLIQKTPLFWICEKENNSSDENKPGIEYTTMDRRYIPETRRGKMGPKNTRPPGNEWWTCLCHSEIGGYDREKNLLTIKPQRLQIIRTEILSDVISKNHQLPTMLDRFEKLSSDKQVEKNTLREEIGEATEDAIERMHKALNQVDKLHEEAISIQMKEIGDGNFSEESVKFFQPREYLAPVIYDGKRHTEDIWGDYNSKTGYGNMISRMNPVFRKMNHIIKISSRNTRVFISNGQTKGRSPNGHWDHRQKKWEYCLNCMCMPEKRANELNKKLKHEKLRNFLKSAIKLNDISLDAYVVQLFYDCREFIYGEYHRFKKIWPTLKDWPHGALLMEYRPHTPALKNMLREIYMDVDKTIVSGASILGVHEVEWDGERHPGHYFWKSWAIETRRILFRMLLLWGFILHRQIVISPNDALGVIFRRFYPGGPLNPEDDAHRVIDFHNFLKFSRNKYVPLQSYIRVWKGVDIARRNDQEFNATIDSILNVFRTDMVQEWDIMDTGVGKHKKICSNLDLMWEKKAERLPVEVLKIIYPEYIDFIKQMKYQYDRTSGHIVPISPEDVNLKRIIETLRDEHVEFIERGLPSYELSKSKVYGSLAFVKTLQLGNDKFPSQLQLVILGTPLEWEEGDNAKLKQGENIMLNYLFQWKIHGIGDNFKLTEWLHGSDDVVRPLLYRVASYTKDDKWKDIVPKLVEAMRHRGDLSHAALNTQLNIYSAELHKQGKIMKNKGDDSKRLDVYFLELQRLQEKINATREKILSGDEEGRVSNEKLREIRKAVKSMVTNHNYSK